MSAASEISPTQQKNQQTTQTAPGQPQVDDGAAKKLRGMDYDAQVAALKPGGDAGTSKPNTAAKTEQKKQQPPAKSRAQILKEQASRMSSLEDLLSYGAFDWAVTDGEATKALNLLAQMPDGEAPVVIQSLNQKNPVFMKRLMENAPAGARKAYPLSYLSIVTVSGQIGELEKMVGFHPSVYGVGPQHMGRTELTWVMQKLSSAFITKKGKENSPPFQRWLELTPDPPKSGVEQIFKAALAAEKDRQSIEKERKADEQRVMDKFDKDKGKDAEALRSRIKSIEELLSYSFTDWAITDAEARRVFSMLTPLDGDAIRYAVMKLDKGPFMDRFIDNLPAADRWNNKKAFLHILSARQPEKNVRFVKELMSYGVFDWAVTDEEARLAFYLVKTMPKDVRDQFKNADGGKWWSRMEGNLDYDTKTAKDANFYNNAEETQKKKLEFQEGAAKWPKGQLKMAIEMLTRMGEEDWVEKQVQGMGFDKKPEFDWVFTEMGFARPGGQRDPKIWKEFKEKSAGAAFVDGMKALGSGAKLLGQAIGGGIQLGVTGKTELDIDLQDVQNVLGGDVAGVKFAKDKDKKGGNKLGLAVDLDKGLVTVNASSLSIASIATLMDTTKIQTGPISVDNVSIVAKWPTPTDPKQFYSLSIGGINAQDIWQITETSMTGVGSIALQNFKVEATMPAGDKPADKTQLLGQALTDIQESMTRVIGMINPKNPQPEQIGMSASQSFRGMAGAKVSLGALDVKDVTLSAGGHIGQAKAEGLELSMTQRQKGDAVRARLTELAQREKKGEKLSEKDLAEKAELQGNLPKIEALEKRQAELQKKRDASEKKELEAHEKEELASIRDQLTVTTTEVGVKSLSVKDVDAAGVKAQSLEVKDLKGRLTAERELGDKNGVIDMNAAGKDAQGKKPDNRIKAEFSVGSMSGKGIVASGKSKLEAYESRIAELKAKIDNKDGTEADSKLLAELKAEIGPVHKDVVERDRLKLIPEGQRTPAQKQALVDLSTKLEPWVGKAPPTTVDEVNLQGKDGKPAIEGKIDAASGKLSLAVADAEVKGVKAKDLQLDGARVQGMTTEVDIGADPRAGLDLTKLAMNTSAKVDHAEINGLRMGGTAKSKVLQDELDKLALQAKLNPGTLDQKSNDRLGALPGLIATALADEQRVAKLRDIQKKDPANFTPAMEQELRTLAERTDPQVTTVKHAELNDVAMQLDTKAGKVELGAGGKGADKPAVKVEGFEVGQLKPDGSVETIMKVDEAKIDKVSAKAKTDGGIESLMDPKKSKDLAGDVGIKGLEVKGLEKRGRTYSTVLQLELDALAAKEKAQLTEADKKRLVELVPLVKQAQIDETRLIELRRTQEQAPDKFTPDMGWEMKALATRLDPKVHKAGKVEVSNIDAKVDTKVGKVELAVGKEGSGTPGIKIQGAEIGTVGRDGKVKTDTKVEQVKLETLNASLDVDPGTKNLFDPAESPTLKANVKAHGLEVAGVEKGKKGDNGYMKMDKASLGDLSASYDAADGGKASLELQGAKLENFEMQSTKLAKLEERMGELLAKGRGGQELTKDEQSELDKLKADHQSYLQLKQKYATAKGQYKKYYETKLKDWEKTQVTGVQKAEITKMSAWAKPTGSMPGAHEGRSELRDRIPSMFDYKKMEVGADIEQMKAEGIKNGDMSLKKADVKGVSFTGSNLMDEEKRKAKVSVKSLEAEGLKQPGTVVGKAKVKDVDAKLNGRSLDAKIKQAHVSGAYSGGSGVGYANASGIGIAMRNMGTEKESMSTAVAHFNAGGITTGTKDNGTTIKKASGHGLSMQSGKGGGKGGGSGINIAGVNAEGIVNTATDKDGTVSVAKVDQAAAKGIGIKTGKNMSVSVNEATVGGVSYDTNKKDGSSSSIKVDSAKVNDVGFTKNDKGGMGATIGSANAKGITYADTKVNADKTKSVTNASVKDVTAGDIGFTKDGSNVGFNVGKADVTDARFGQKTLEADGKTVKDSKNASVGSIGINGVKGSADLDKGGFSAKVDGVNVKDARYAASDKDGNKTGASVGSIDIKDIGAGGNFKDGVYGGSVGKVDVKDARYSDTKVAKDGTVTKTGASVDQIGVTGVRGMADTKSGSFVGGVEGVDVKGTKFATSDNKGMSQAGNVDAVNIKGITAMGNYKSGVFGGGAESLDVKGINYAGKDGKGGSTNAKVESFNAQGLSGYADTKNKTYGGGFKSVKASEVDVTQKGADGSVTKVQTDHLKAGDGKSFSSVIYGPDGKLNGDIKAIELGPNTGKDGKVGNVFEQTNAKGEKTSLKLGDEKGQAGKFTVGQVKMRDFNPADITAKGSSLQVFDIGADKFVFNNDTHTVVGNGAKLDSVFVKGQGEGKTMAGFSGLEVKDASVREKNAYPEWMPGGRDKEIAGIKDLKSSGGYAIMQGLKPGEKFDVAYAKLNDLSAGEIRADIKLPPPTYEDAVKSQKDAQKNHANRPGYDPSKDRIDLSGLSKMNGSVGAKYTYNKDDDTVLDSVGAFFTGRSASVSTEIKNGNVDLATTQAGMDGFSVAGMVGNPLIKTVQGGANIAGLLGPADMVNIPSLAGGEKGKEAYDKAPEMKDLKPEDFSPEKLKESRDWMTRTDINADLKDLGGGKIQYGRDFQGDMKEGGELKANGNLGEKLTVQAKNIGFDNIQAMDGKVSIGHAGMKEAEVKLYNLGDPTNSSVVANVKDAKITKVEYGGGGAVDKEKLDADFAEMTKKK
ncbi:MAG: hypothetical protein IT385_21965 [Deltaproteobacteria bacterium]|nr:hypothetical protein [Deltaproteobacteria bacterium]